MRGVLLVVLLALLASANGREPRSARLFDQWKRADSNREGMLSRSEVNAVPALAPHFDAIDRDANGAITADEVRSWRTSKRSARSARAPSGMASVFREADADGDGMLSRAEVEARLPRLARNFGRIDADRDGFLSRGELESWTARRRPVK